LQAGKLRIGHGYGNKSGLEMVGITARLFAPQVYHGVS